MPVWIELMALQTRAIEVDALAVQMAQAEARRSELEVKVLEIKEEEDNHIAFLEAQLEGLSLVEEDKKVDDEFEGTKGLRSRVCWDWVMMTKQKQNNKQGHGKGEDKGKLSPRRVVQPGAASSSSLIRVPPPLSPHTGGAAPGLVPAVGGISGHMKLEPPTKFTGKGFPTIRDWLEETANWLELSPCTPDQWINIAGTRLEKGTSNWFWSEKVQIIVG